MRTLGPGLARPPAAWTLVGLSLLAVGACHDPDAPPQPTPDVRVTEDVLAHMAPGGQVRRVIYEPPPDLTLTDPDAIELPFPGPGIEDPTVGPEPDDPVEEEDPVEEDEPTAPDAAEEPVDASPGERPPGDGGGHF
jgi:hypothetical protein